MVKAGRRRGERADRDLLAFVLCGPSARKLTGRRVLSVWKKFGPSLELKLDEHGSGLQLDFGPYGAIVVDGPFRIPNDEAEGMERFSVAGFWQYDPPERHVTHLIVNMFPLRSARPLDQYETFCALLAALISSVNAAGVYWGDAQATHPAELVLDVVQQGTPRSVLWSGVSYGRVPKHPDLVSFLSRGLRRLGLKEIEVWVPIDKRGEGLDALLNLVEYTAQRGADIPDRDTFGREAGEKLRVRHVRSPVDQGEKVVLIRLP
jgi:hypothetical protein